MSLLIKFCCHFFFLAYNLHNFHDFKLFWNKQRLNPVIPNNEVYGINSCNIKRVLVGASHKWCYNWLFDWFNCHAWLMLFCSMICSKLFLNCALTSLFDNLLWLIAQIRIYSHSGLSIYMFWFSYVHDSSGYSLILSSIVMITSFY